MRVTRESSGPHFFLGAGLGGLGFPRHSVLMGLGFRGLGFRDSEV